jgi:hypothetical protein
VTIYFFFIVQILKNRGSTIKYTHEMSDSIFQGRAVRTSYRLVPKSAMVKIDTGSDRECFMANLSGIPYDYVHPSDTMTLNTVPFKWPQDEEWTTRMGNW